MTHKKWKENWDGKTFTNDIHILKLKSSMLENTVAHAQTFKGWITENIEILKLKNCWDSTVAHYQAKLGWTTENTEILQLVTKPNYKTKKKKSVAQLQIENGWIPPKHLFSLKIEADNIYQIYKNHLKSKI